MSKQRRWRCRISGHKVRAPLDGRAWCRFCDDYVLVVKATRQEWLRGENVDKPR